MRPPTRVWWTGGLLGGPGGIPGSSVEFIGGLLCLHLSDRNRDSGQRQLYGIPTTARHSRDCGVAVRALGTRRVGKIACCGVRYWKQPGAILPTLSHARPTARAKSPATPARTSDARHGDFAHPTPLSPTSRDCAAGPRRCP